MAVKVEFPDPEPNGLASMLGGLIEGNLEAHPNREALLAKPATYSITAPDVDVSVSIRLAPGAVTVRNGVVGTPQISIRTNSDNLMGMSSVPLKFGLPDSMTKEGREVNKKLFKGELKVKGMWTHLGALARLNRLLSVR